MTIGTDGFAIISHFEDDDSDLVVTHCGNVACTTASTTSYPTPNNDGNETSITIGADGNPIISHSDTAARDLVVTHLSKSAWTDNGWD